MADDFTASTSTTGVLAVGGFVTGNIETAGDSDWFAITLAAGTRYQFFLQGSQIVQGTHSGGTLPNPVLRLHDASGAVIATADDEYGFNALLNFTAQTSGTYYLDASSAVAPNTGTYTISAKPFGSIAQIADYEINGFWQFTGSTARAWDHSIVTVDISQLAPAEQILAMKTLDLYDDVANITFSYTTGAADITFNHNGSGVAQGGGGVNAGHALPATVQISSDIGVAELNSHMFQVYLHEVGHALGLGHSGPYNGGSLSYSIDNLFANDTLQTTVMTYFGWPTAPLHDHVITPQMAEIYALQLVYGANNTTRLGDTTYGFNSTEPFYNFAAYGPAIAFTIYDSGGLDTLDASGYGMNQLIDLRPGQFSSIGGYTDNIAIYLTTQIETGVGGAGNDTLTGGDIDNILIGGPGNDTLNGGLGRDTASYAGASGTVSVSLLIPGAQNTGQGADTLIGIENLIGGAFDDTLTGDSGANVLAGGGGADTLIGGAGDDVYLIEQLGDVIVELGDGGDDTVRTTLPNVTLATFANVEHLIYIGDAPLILLGDDGANALNGGGGNDYLYAYGGDDVTTGGAGVDVFVLGDGNDTASGGDGQDYFYGENGNDTLSGDSGVDVFIAGAGTDVMYGGEGGDFFYGEDGADLGIGGGGNDIFVMAGGADIAYGDEGQDYFYMGDGDDVMHGGAGVDVMLGEAGNDTFNGGLGVDYLFLGPTGAGDNDTVIVDKNLSGVTVINAFEAGGTNDVIRLLNTGLTNFGQVQAAITDFTASGNFCVITIDSDTNIWLIGVQPSQLTSADFAFA